MLSMLVFNFAKSTSPSAKSWSIETADDLAFFPGWKGKGLIHQYNCLTVALVRDV